MVIFTLDRDIKLLSVTAPSFADGIMQAHAWLHQRVPFSADRNYFGLSRPENNGPIVSRAATEPRLPDEAARYHGGTRLLKKGKYIFHKTTAFSRDPGVVGKIFHDLLATPGLDRQGYGVESYSSDLDTLTCMIRLEDKNRSTPSK